MDNIRFEIIRHELLSYLQLKCKINDIICNSLSISRTDDLALMNRVGAYMRTLQPPFHFFVIVNNEDTEAGFDRIADRSLITDYADPNAIARWIAVQTCDFV